MDLGPTLVYEQYYTYFILLPIHKYIQSLSYSSVLHFLKQTLSITKCKTVIYKTNACIYKQGFKF